MMRSGSGMARDYGPGMKLANPAGQTPGCAYRARMSALECFPSRGPLVPILENADIMVISPQMLDLRLVTGWRHFGTNFFRYNFAIHEGELCGVLPLRLPLENFEPSKSQRRILRKNADLDARFVPSGHSPEHDRLFDRHKARFRENVPDSLRDFLSAAPAELPCANLMLEVRLNGELIAASFLDLGAEATSSVYAAFDPAHEARSLGIFTLLREIEYARELGKRFHYLGYSYTVPAFYDYKKRFNGIEGYDWDNGWVPLPKDFQWSRRMEPDA
jgi:arginine-tRNA-protein transferase